MRRIVFDGPETRHVRTDEGVERTFLVGEEMEVPDEVAERCLALNPERPPWGKLTLNVDPPYSRPVAGDFGHVVFHEVGGRKGKRDVQEGGDR